MFALLCLSVGVVFGRAGMVALCPMAFAAIGALTTALANHLELGLPFPVLLVVAGLVTVPFGVAIGLPALRLRGLNLAIVTLSFAVAVARGRQHRRDSPVARRSRSCPGRTGPPTTPPTSWCAGWSSWWPAWCCRGWAPAGAGRPGSPCAPANEATAATGLSVPRVKLTAFAVSAFLAGVAGSLLAGELGQLNATGFDPLQSLTIFALAVMVGARYPEGAALGGILAAFLPELLRQVDLPQDLAGVIFAVGAAFGLAKGSGGAAADLRAAGRSLFAATGRQADRPVESIVDVPRLQAGAAGRERASSSTPATCACATVP